MKKSVVLFTLLSILLLSACGGGGSSQSVNGGKTSGDKGAEVANTEKKVIEYWYIETGEKEKVLLEAVKRFEEKNPGVEVKTLQTPNDAYKQKFAVAMSGGTPPDVFHSWGGGWLKEFVNQGNVLDLTGKIDEDNYVSTVLSNSIFDEKVYGAPLGVSVGVMWYNKEMFEKYELEAPNTWEEFIHVVDTLKQNSIIPIALANQPKWPALYYMMYLADRIGGADLFTSALNRTGKGFDDEAYVKAGELIQDLVKRDAFNKGFNGIPYDAGQGRQLLYTNQAAMMLMSNAFVNAVRSEAPDFEKKLDFFLFPTVTDGEGDPSNINGSTAPVWSVSAKSKYPELAVELVKELTSTETAQIYSDRTSALVGVKGIEYKDEYAKRLAASAEKASSFSWPYDQAMPPELAQQSLDTTQALFGLSMTPEEAANKVEQEAKKILK